MRKVRENILPAKGNYQVFPADTAVFTCDASGMLTINGLLDGQLVFYDYETNMSIGAGATVDDYDRIVIGVGVDESGLGGAATTIRAGYGDKLYGCDIDKATAKGPRCGENPIMDVGASCVHCDEDFTINITVENDTTEAQYPYNRPATYTYTVNTGCCACDTCEDGVDCKELWCKMADQINAVNAEKNSIKSQGAFLGKAAKQYKKNLPFKAYPLFENDYVWCIDPQESDCDKCIHMDAITGVRINGQAYPFTATVDPQNPTLSFQGQLGRIEALINQAFYDAGQVGSAVFTSGLVGSGAPCCPMQLRVNSCQTVEILGAGGQPIVPCQPATNPFEAIVKQGACKGCGTDSSSTPTCGLRIVAKPLSIECECIPGEPRTRFVWHKLDVNAGENGGGFACGAFWKKQVQEGVVPENMGYEWFHRALAQDTGGRGRDIDPWVDARGRYNAPLKGGRLENNTNIDCKAGYCSYHIEHKLPNSDTGVHGNKTASRGRTTILIPSGDDVTIAEFEAILNPYLLSSKCPVKKEVNC